MTRFLTTVVALLFSMTLIGLGNDDQAHHKMSFPQWGFCVAYQVRDADEREARPVDAKTEKDVLSKDRDSKIPHGLMNDRHIVDVAALSTRIVKSGVLKRDTADKVVLGATQGKERHPLMDCYDPHHIFIFYDYDGHPVAAIEVCFSCNRVRMTPEIRPWEGKWGLFETSDLALLAKIASEAGLDLKPFESVDKYVQRLETISKRVKERTEQDSDSKGE